MIQEKTQFCDDCHEPITWGIFKASINRFGRSLCIQCQGKEIKATYPEKLREFALKNLVQYGYKEDKTI